MSKTWNDMIKPVVVLTIICLAVSAALAFTNDVTAPIIEQNANAAADEARIELLPEADAFTLVEYTGAGVVEVYKANNGAGYVITGTQSGYDGQVPIMVAFGKDDKIVNIKALDNTETPGLGKKVEEPAFTNQFAGKDAKELELGVDIDSIAGATISSGAATDAVNFAIAAYNEVAKGIVTEEPTEQDYVNGLLPEGTTATLLDMEVEGANAIYETDAGYTVVVAEAPGFDEGMIFVYVAIDEADGGIYNLKVDASTQTKGLGTKVEKEEFANLFIGQQTADDVEIIAGATISSEATKVAVNNALAAYHTVKGA